MFKFLESNKRIYLDYASSTPIDKEVFSSYQLLLKDFYANASAIHKEGVMVSEKIDSARHKISKVFQIQSKEIIFTASATESINLAIFGTINSARKNPLLKNYEKLHVIVSSIEHSAVLESVRQLEKQGIIDVDYVGVNRSGVVDLVEFKKLLRAETVLVSIMYVNNEIGSIQPISEIAKIIRHARKHHRQGGASHLTAENYPYLHSDASQGINLININLQSLGVDMLSLGSSKIYGPKGVGFLYKKNNINIDPIIFGGGQEIGLRSGTENVPAIVSFSQAIEKSQSMVMLENIRITNLRDLLLKNLSQTISDIIFHGDSKTNIGGIVSFTIPKVESDMLVLYLDARGFAVSSKSACHSELDEISHVLVAMYGDEAQNIGGTVRVSIGRYTTENDLEKFVKNLKEVIQLLQK